MPSPALRYAPRVLVAALAAAAVLALCGHPAERAAAAPPDPAAESLGAHHAANHAAMRAALDHRRVAAGAPPAGPAPTKPPCGGRSSTGWRPRATPRPGRHPPP